MTPESHQIAKKVLTLTRNIETLSQMQALKHVFNIIDSDGDGDFNRSDCVLAFKMMELSGELTTKDLDIIFEDCDEGAYDDNGKWQPVQKMGSFTTMVFETKLPCLRSFVTRSRKYREMFTVFDRDNTGFMNAEELGTTITKLFGWRPTRYESEKLLATVDQDGGGVIDFVEFVNMLHYAQSPALAKVDCPLELPHTLSTHCSSRLMLASWVCADPRLA